MRTRTRNFSSKTDPEEITKSYIIEYEGQYFAGWTGTDWVTVPRVAKWTRKRRNAEQIKIDTVVERQDLINLVVGFSNTHLLVVNMEDQRSITPKRKQKVWSTKL